MKLGIKPQVGKQKKLDTQLAQAGLEEMVD
jgi:hypothetical protein